MNARLNNFLSGKFEEKKIQETIFDVGGSKALGLDGFYGCFFQTFWEILCKDIMMMVHEFQASKSIPKDMNFTFISLIPKEIDANYFGKFHPINLCNFLYKINSKVMENS